MLYYRGRYLQSPAPKYIFVSQIIEQSLLNFIFVSMFLIGRRKQILMVPASEIKSLKLLGADILT